MASSLFLNNDLTRDLNTNNYGVHVGVILVSDDREYLFCLYICLYLCVYKIYINAYIFAFIRIYSWIDRDMC